MKDSVLVKAVQRWAVRLGCLLILGLAGCPEVLPGDRPGAHESGNGASLESVNLSDPIHPVADTQPIHLRAAQNEWTTFALQVNNVEPRRRLAVRLSNLSSAGGTISLRQFTAYQILAMPVEVNPGYVRHTGLNSANRSIPRALLEAPLENGSIRVTSLRDPTDPTNPSAHPNGATVLLWIDLQVPPYTPAGDYAGSCELTDRAGLVVGASLPLHLTVYDFALPVARHLQMVGQADWDRLAALYPASFGDTITPSLINRGDPRYRQTISTLDQMMSVSEQHRALLALPGLRPTVKWPAGQAPLIDWSEFDSLVGPWMSGELFPDRVPLRYFPLPAAQSLDRYDPRSRADYWAAAASHFQQLGWLDRAPVWLGNQDVSLSSPTRADALCDEAARILGANPQVKVALPLQDEQLARGPQPIGDSTAERIITAGVPLIWAVPNSPASPDLPSRQHWLRTDLPGLVPYAGAGSDERDVRVWAWLAFLRRGDLIVWDHALPTVDSPSDPADPNMLTWFYPGQWFGVPHPVPTIQLAWLRRAQQDYEYLWLAAQHGEVINALQMARLITKPVEIQPGQAADPVYALLTGTTSQQAWDRAQELLAKTILLRKPGHPVNEAEQRALYIETLQWAQPQERPQLLARWAKWTLDAAPAAPQARAAGNWLRLDLSLDIYNASDMTPDKNSLQWDPPSPQSGWQVRPQPVDVLRLQTYHVQPATLSAEFNLDRITPDAGKPVGLRFINGFTKAAYPLSVRLPVAMCERHEGPLAIDGRLNDWSDADALQDGPLVLMMDRPDVQKQELRFVADSSKVYSAYGRENFYVAFSLEGLMPDEHQAHNDVYYQARRAWGEDLCEVLIQPVYRDNFLGPVLHVVCKPNGADWTERKEDTAPPEVQWRPAAGAVVRYATTTTDGRWRGELAIPWKLINAPDKEAPVLLRFNFCQHRRRNCESASWCGPVDFGRDPNMMGVLYLHNADAKESPAR